jgi:glycine/D-amino acid oxidase-like deaminating enzyme
MRAFARNGDLLKKFLDKNQINCSTKDNGTILVSTSKDGASLVQNVHEKMLDGSYVHAHISTDQARQIIPSEAVHESLFIPGQVSVDPLRLMNIVAKKLESSSKTRFITNSHVNSVEQLSDDSFNVHVEGGDLIRADYVVHANNHTADLEYIRGYREQLIATDELPASVVETFPPMPIFMDGGNICYRLHCDRMLCSFLDTSLDMVAYDYMSTRALSESTTRNAIQTTSIVFPSTTIATPQNIWSRMVYTTDDELPVVGRVGNEDEFAICAFGTRDLGLSFLASSLLVKRMIDNATTALGKLFDTDRFQNEGD